MSICNESKNGYKLANIRCEIREIRLNNKPEHMLKVSPKGTVPVLYWKIRLLMRVLKLLNGF